MCPSSHDVLEGSSRPKNGHKNWLCQLDRLYNWVERVETTTHLDIVAGTWLCRSEQPSFSKRQLDLRSSSVRQGRDEFDKAGWTAGLDWVKNVWLGWVVRYHWCHLESRAEARSVGYPREGGTCFGSHCAAGCNSKVHTFLVSLICTLW